MDRFTTWNDVKNSMTSLTEEEKMEVDLLSEIIA